MEDRKQKAKMNVPMSMWNEDDGGTPPKVGDPVCVYGTVQGMTNANILVDVEKVEPDSSPEAEGDEGESTDTNNSEQAQPEMGMGSSSMS